mmetsp:Transcript_52240/g.53220  ORF Transcript_52240/g.53220 Transcript_52240/m.53220 type:complete len:106 (-) Transcript_52240:401-718(-)
MSFTKYVEYLNYIELRDTIYSRASLDAGKPVASSLSGIPAYKLQKQKINNNDTLPLPTPMEKYLLIIVVGLILLVTVCLGMRRKQNQERITRNQYTEISTTIVDV